MRKNSSVCLALFSLAVALVATAPVFAESLSAKQIIRQSAMAYQQMETYQDKSMMQIDLGDTMASMPGNVSEAQKQQMLEMTKMQMDFGFKRPRQFAMNLKSFMFNADTSCDGKTLTYLIANLMGQPLNQYQQRNVENASIDKVLDEMASSLAMQGQMKGQSHQSDVVYSMLLADNPLEAFSKMIDSVSPEAVREKKQIRMNADQSEFKDVYILQGNFAVDQTYGKGITAVAKVTMDAKTSLIYGYDVDMKMDMREMKKNMPPQMAASMKQDEMRFGLKVEHVDIQLNETIPDERFVFTVPEGAQRVDTFNMQELMQKAMTGAMSQQGAMPGAPGAQPTPSKMIQVGSSVGKAAADFSLPSLDSQTVTLSQFKGKPVMLAFLASWSGSCKRQAPIVETVFQASKSQDLVVIGIFSERAEDKIKEFATTQGLTFPIVVDAEKSVMKDFNVNSWPCFVLLDKEGSVKKELPGMRTSDELREALGTLGQ